MNYTFKNRTTKEILVINESQAQLVYELIERKILFENDWTIEPVDTIKDVTKKLYG